METMEKNHTHGLASWDHHHGEDGDNYHDHPSKPLDVWEFTEDVPTYVSEVADLWHWSTNYDAGKGPFTLFLDLIGYSQEEFGEALYGSDFETGLGYVELGKLAKALTEYADRPSDVRAWVEELLTYEDA